MTTKVLLGFTLALLSLKIYSQYSWQSGPFKTCQIMLLLCLKFGNGSHLTQINIKVFQVVYKALHYQVPIPSLTFYPGSPTPDRCTLAILVMMFFERSWCPIDMWPLSLIEPRHCLKILPNLPLNLLFSVKHDLTTSFIIPTFTSFSPALIFSIIYIIFYCKLKNSNLSCFLFSVRLLPLKYKIKEDIELTLFYSLRYSKYLK